MGISDASLYPKQWNFMKLSTAKNFNFPTSPGRSMYRFPHQLVVATAKRGHGFLELNTSNKFIGTVWCFQSAGDERKDPCWKDLVHGRSRFRGSKPPVTGWLMGKSPGNSCFNQKYGRIGSCWLFPQNICSILVIIPSILQPTKPSRSTRGKKKNVYHWFTIRWPLWFTTNDMFVNDCQQLFVDYQPLDH